MAIDINLNLKTINGQTLTGTGNVSVNSINWRGDFSTAPSLPVLNDAYHNTTTGSSYIYNGTTWVILAQKGDPGPVGSTGMMFPHTTLTGADVGKLVILKDGLAQLPVFEPAQEAKNEIVKFTFIGGDVHLANFPVIFEFEMTTQPTPLDTFTFNAAITNEGIATPEILTFVVSASGANDVEIGATITDTLTNLVAKIVEVSETHVNATKAGDFFTISYGCLGLSYDSAANGKITLFENLAGVTLPSCITLSDSNAIGRVQEYLLGFYIVKGLRDAGLITGYLNERELFNWYFSDYSIYTTGLNPFGTQSESRPCADSLSEHKAGLVQKLNSLENIESAYFEGNVLYIEHTFDEFSFTTPTDEDLYPSGMWTDFSVDQEAEPAYPPLCKYPIIGLVKSVTIDQVEIYTEPICNFKLQESENINSWGSLIDMNRIFILSSSSPGRLTNLTPYFEAGYDLPAMLKALACGYVVAYSQDQNGAFLGSFSLDLFSIQVFYLLFIAGDGGV